MAINTLPLSAQNRAPNPNEVAVYEHINFVGKQRIWALEPGMRQKLVPFVGNDINDMISSIQVGAKVGVMFFVDANYRGKGNTTIQSINSLPPEYNDAISSLIIFPREWLSPIGVSLAGPSVGTTPLGGFFPAPEKMSDPTASYPYIGDDLNDKVQVAYVWPSSTQSPVSNQLEVKLCEHVNFGGKCITIPGPGSPVFKFELSDYQFSGITSSLQVTHFPVRSLQERPARPLQKR